MIAELRRYGLVLRAAIFILPLISFVLAAFLSVHWFGIKPEFTSAEFLYLALFTTMVWSIVAERQEVSSITKVSAENTGIRASFAACGITFVANLIALFFVHQLRYSRAFIVLSAVSLLLLTVSIRTLVRILLRTVGGHRSAVRVLIVGTGRFAAQATARIQSNEFVRSMVVGYIQLPGEEIRVTNVPVFQIDQLDTIDRLNADNIVIAVPTDEFSGLRRCLSKLNRLGKPIRILVNFGNGMKVRDRVVEFGRLQMLDLDPSPMPSIGYFLFKRVFDMVFASAVLLVLAIPMLVIALAIWLTSRGPILFKQERVGRNGKVFTMYKFRTMRVSSAYEGDTLWTGEDDPRRTAVGAFLRKSSLDELPQFFNVLKGEMSVVGPRPERPHFVGKFRKDITLYQTRHHLNVGITGWAQVNGLRGDTSIPKRIRYDLYYLHHWSLYFDMQIILMTIWGGFMGKNAY
ncbi:MAG TPA: exopolysaccharide biosynthesis polyprenyl glycosylphosphotransferase [Terracidiphilus sp.]|jgi:Undecaprenyl-phosphate glucose phosphotransferase